MSTRDVGIAVGIETSFILDLMFFVAGMHRLCT